MIGKLLLNKHSLLFSSDTNIVNYKHILWNHFHFFCITLYVVGSLIFLFHIDHDNRTIFPILLLETNKCVKKLIKLLIANTTIKNKLTCFIGRQRCRICFRIK